jgi:DNA-binding NarL/FixJ family response regulator
LKTRAELDAEIQRENIAITQHNKSVYRWSRVKDRIARDEHIMELWAMGESREEIAEQVDLSPQRVSQIVNGFGAGWR